ncbi:MAG: APC family permease [Thermoplasmataceae archaeon]
MANEVPAESRTDKFRLAKQVGVLAVISSAVANEYGVGINLIAVGSLGPYPAIGNLIPLAMLVAGLLLLPKVFMFQGFARFASRASGEYVWVGRTLSPGVAFVVSFVWWVGFVSAIGVVGFAIGTFLASTLGTFGIISGAFYSTTSGHITIGLVVLAAFFGLHYLGIKLYGWLVSIFLVIVVIAAVITIFVGLLTSPSIFIHALQAKGISLTTTTTPSSLNSGTFLAVVTLFIFSYGGISSAPMLGGETKNASRNQPLGIVGGWLLVMVLYTFVAYAIVHVAPATTILALLHSNQSYYATVPGIISLVSSPFIGNLMAILIFIIVLKTMIPQLLSTSRMFFGWSEDGIVPGIFSKVNKFKVPVYAVLLTALLGAVFLIEDAYTGFVIGTLVRSISILLMMAFVGMGVLAAKLKKDKTELEKSVSSWSMVIAGIAAIIVMIILIGSIAYIPGKPYYMQPLFTTAVSTIVAVLIYIYALVRHKQKSGESLEQKLKKELPID